MAQLLIRDLDPALIKRLKQQAKLHHRSLQGEVKSLVIAGTKMTMEEALQKSEKIRKNLARRSHTDSVKLLRALREGRTH